MFAKKKNFCDWFGFVWCSIIIRVYFNETDYWKDNTKRNTQIPEQSNFIWSSCKSKTSLSRLFIIAIFYKKIYWEENFFLALIKVNRLFLYEFNDSDMFY